jgi:hypothetical protein
MNHELRIVGGVSPQDVTSLGPDFLCAKLA